MATTQTAVEPDAIQAFKQKQRETWAMGDFGVIATLTTLPAANLVRFAGVKPGQRVLDVGTGTGVVAITAARTGAEVTGLDLTPELLSQARGNSAVAGLNIKWDEGDVERLPYPDASFDVVLSQYGHMFAPRPDVALKEMLRVLRPRGTVAFSTWPPEQLIGRQFTINSKFVPPPVGVPSPVLWGDMGVVKERLGTQVQDAFFERGLMPWIALSPQHYRTMQERYAGPFVRTLRALENDPVRLAAWRQEFDELVKLYHRDNVVWCEYLMTRATKP